MKRVASFTRPATTPSERRPVFSEGDVTHVPRLPAGFVTTNVEYSPNVSRATFVTRTRYAPTTRAFAFVWMVPVIVQSGVLLQRASRAPVHVGAVFAITVTVFVALTTESCASGW